MKFSIPVVALACGLLCSSRAEELECRWGEFGYLSNWYRPPYRVETKYEFVGRLPDLREFPKLLKLAHNPKFDDGDRGILVSQLRTLSRCDFEEVLYADDDEKAEYRKAISRWEEWWMRYGSQLPQVLAATGKRHEAAWKEVAPTPYLEGPRYLISIPDEWTTKISFRSGDYGGVTEEVIEIRVKSDACHLQRKYRQGWIKKDSPWTEETWKDFTRDEADRFFAAIVYAIDHPWFYSQDKITTAEKKAGELPIGSIRGRPKGWSAYLASDSWTGILDAGGKVVLNHNPWRWHSVDPFLDETSSLDTTIGIAFRVARDLFPDPSWIPSESRWQKQPQPTVQQKPSNADKAVPRDKNP